MDWNGTQEAIRFKNEKLEGCIKKLAMFQSILVERVTQVYECNFMILSDTNWFVLNTNTMGGNIGSKHNCVWCQDNVLGELLGRFSPMILNLPTLRMHYNPWALGGGI
jgi:hypothetical protein